MVLPQFQKHSLAQSLRIVSHFVRNFISDGVTDGMMCMPVVVEADLRFRSKISVKIGKTDAEEDPSDLRRPL